MHLADEFRSRKLSRGLLGRIKELSGRPVNLMEVCGTHTVNFFRFGLRTLLPSSINLLSGPGCPVCVTPTEDVDAALALAGMPGVILVTFGDMMRVPGSRSSLEKERAEGKDIRVVYSSLDALSLAEKEKEKKIVFFAVGFETTQPGVACTVLEARERDLANFFLLVAHKVIPPAMEVLLAGKEVHIDAFLCPGHVSTIIGAHPYEFIPEKYGVPCVITGFEPLDILRGVEMSLTQIEKNSSRVEIQYRRCVREEGNKEAQKRIAEVFEVVDAPWRGLGEIPASGLALREDFSPYDARKAFPLQLEPAEDPPECRCGEILRGVIIPPECPQFGKVCHPENPLGPCMVSSEGTCAAYYRYGSVVA